jgi:hypothetical protein
VILSFCKRLKPKGEYHDANKIDYSQVDLAMKLIRPPVPEKCNASDGNGESTALSYFI